MDSRDRVRVASLATAVPRHRIPQAEVVEFFRRFFDASITHRRRLEQVYLNAAIETRYACEPVEWYEQPHGLKEKNDKFIEHAVALLKQVALDALAGASLECRDIDMLVVVSTTGVAVPSLDARLMEALPFRRDVQRLPIFGLGCGGGVMGLARAATCARTGGRVLFLVVELCTLTFCPNDRAKANIVATALFGDGAAGAVLSTDSPGPAIVANGEHTWRDSLDVMGWDVTDSGLEVIMARSIPDIVKRHMREATDSFLESEGLALADIGHFVCHPGGAKVLDALEDLLDVPNGGLVHSREVLRQFGNMSAVTVLFVLKRVLEWEAANPCGGATRPRLLTSLGPGFSLSFLVLE